MRPLLSEAKMNGPIDQKSDISPIVPPPRSRSWTRRRFMRRLSVSVKLWITMAILGVPLIGLGIFYVQSLTSTLWFTRTEQKGAALYLPLDRFMSGIDRHGALGIASLARRTEVTADLSALEAQTDEQLRALEALDRKSGNAATHGQLQKLRSAFNAMKSAPASSIEANRTLHAAVFAAGDDLKGQIGSDWLLILDPELASYNLIDVWLTKLPDAGRFIEDLQARVAVLGESDVYSPAQIAEATALSALLRDRLTSAQAELQSATAAAADRPELARQIAAVGLQVFAELETWNRRLADELRNTHPNVPALHTLWSNAVELNRSLDAARDGVHKAARTALEQRQASQATRATAVLSSSAVALVLAILLMLAIASRLSGAVRRLLAISERIADGHYDNPIDESGTDEISRLFAGIAGMQRKLESQIAAERVAAAQMTRIKQALDAASSSLMLADENFDIIYLNRAAERLFNRCDQDFRRDLPQFDGSRMLNCNIDIFQREPALQRQTLAHLTGAQSTDIRIGDHALRIVSTPVSDRDGQRIGTVVEWLDRSVEVNAEEELGRVVESALEGDLSARIETRNKEGFHATMAASLNRMVDNLRDIVRQVKGAANEVHRGADEITQGNANLSQRTEAQSSSLEETASSMEEMTSTVKQNADNALLANQLATAARTRAENGGAVTSDAVRAMSAINESSKKIADIIGVIDEIAFQTNLLALNAAVEAARAGEQGRGFAVVASEVRNLAGRSATAAREIKELIQDSVKKVEDGSVLVSQSGAALEEIVAAVKKVSDIVGEIAAASREQSSGIEQVNRAVMQIDEMTQQNAALVEQATAASQSMTNRASELNEVMARYKLGDPGSTSVIPFPSMANPKRIKGSRP